MDAISGIHSVSISLGQLKRARAQLGIYLQKFRNKLKGKNRVYVTQVVRLLDSLATYLEGKATQKTVADGVVQVMDLMAGKGVDQISLHKLSQYLQESKLARKVDGYVAQAEVEDKERRRDRISVPVLTQVQSFFQALTNAAADGRFFHSSTEDHDVCLKYLLLDPQHHFREIVEEARTVILAGGTMSPVRGKEGLYFQADSFQMEDYTRHLFPYLEPSSLRTLSCGHVIPDENLIAWPISRGPSSQELEFTFEKRNLSSTIQDLGNCIIELCSVIPDGLVVFFSSYVYLEQVVAKWKSSNEGRKSIWDEITARKPTFRESKEHASVDDILWQYSEAISAGHGKGALLLSVVGGKMSEGINFSDRLGRGVVVVGLPFPNIQSAEWKAKMEYVEQQTVSNGGNSVEGKAAARDFYENACMRAVNQSIGRAIRHQKDYASIVMLDRRYNTPRICGKLPGWIRKGLVEDAGQKRFAEVVGSIREFFKQKML